MLLVIESAIAAGVCCLALIVAGTIGLRLAKSP
jgi:multidrug transporter EmrE-like cation transporter